MNLNFRAEMWNISYVFLGFIGHRAPDFEHPKGNPSWNGFHDFRRFRHQNQSRLRCLCHYGITGGNYRLTSKFAPCARYFLHFCFIDHAKLISNSNVFLSWEFNFWTNLKLWILKVRLWTKRQFRGIPGTKSRKCGPTKSNFIPVFRSK